MDSEQTVHLAELRNCEAFMPEPIQQPDLDSGSNVYLRVKELEGWITSVFEESPVGVVRTDMLFRLTYANKKAKEICGIDSWENLNILDLVPDRPTMQLLEEKLINRRRGLSEEYEAEVLRPSDRRRIPIKIAAMPVIDGEGKVKGAVSIIRSLELERASQSIDRSIQSVHDAQSLFEAVVRETRRIIPFDACTVTLYSRDESHARILFTDCPELLDLYALRWFTMSPTQKEWVRKRSIEIVPDTVQFLKNMESEYVERSLDIVQRLGWSSFVRYPVIREDKVVGSFSLTSKKKQAYSDADRKKLVALPLDTALATALHFDEVHDLEFRLTLVQDVLRCESNQQVFELLVNRIAKHYSWQCVQIFSVNEESETLVLQTQCASVDELKLPVEYQQSLDKGVLGHVYRNHGAVNISDVRIDPRFCQIFVRANNATISELSMPIVVSGEVRAILNIEDNRESAFASEEVDTLQLILKEVEGVMQRFRNERLIASSYAVTPSAVWVIDKRGYITRANPSAQKLLGYTERDMVGTLIADYFQDRGLGEALIRSSEPMTTEVILLNSKKSPISVLLGGGGLDSEFAGEKVIVARDLRGHRRIEQMQLLDQLLYEISTQVRTPLILACDWLKKLKNSPTLDSVADIADKAFRQLEKAEITYDRLALISQHGGMPYHPVLIDIGRLLKDSLSEFPESETKLVHLEFPSDTVPLINGDHYQLRFIFKTTLSYLLRFSTDHSTISVKLGTTSRRIALTMFGPRGSLQGSTQQRRRSDEAFAVTLSNMALGQPVIQHFVQNMKGEMQETVLEPDLAAFHFEFPLERSRAL